MSDADLLGLWSARREGALEDPRPEGLSAASYGPSDQYFGLDDEAHVAAWVDAIEEVQLYHRALVILLSGGLMPHQALERSTMIRQASKVRSRTWQIWAKAWGLKKGTPLFVGRFVIEEAVKGIAKHRQWLPPEIEKKHGQLCEEEELAGQTPDVVAKAEAKYPDRFAKRGAGYLVASWGPDGSLLRSA